MWILTRLPERVLRAAASAGLCAIYFLQKASFLPTFLRRVPKGFFSTTSSLEESSLDDDEEDDAFAAVDAGAAASSVLAYLVARSSMSFVCHSKKPSCAGAGGEATKRYGVVVSRVVRRRTLRRGRVAGVGASGRGRSKADGRRSQDLDVLLRRDGVAAGDGREACGQSGVISARRAARGRAAARAQRSGHPWRRRAGEIRGGRCHLELAPFPASGGIESCGYAPDAAAKLPTTIAERIRMVAAVGGAKL